MEYYKALINKPATFFDAKNPNSLSNDVEIFGRSIEDASGVKIGLALYLFFWLLGGFAIAFVGYNQIFWVWLVAIPVMWGTTTYGYWTTYSMIARR